jgi:hypothetical protein
MHGDRRDLHRAYFSPEGGQWAHGYRAGGDQLAADPASDETVHPVDAGVKDRPLHRRPRVGAGRAGRPSRGGCGNDARRE